MEKFEITVAEVKKNEYQHNLFVENRTYTFCAIKSPNVKNIKSKN